MKGILSGAVSGMADFEDQSVQQKKGARRKKMFGDVTTQQKVDYLKKADEVLSIYFWINKHP